jgi:hypothetical protein
VRCCPSEDGLFWPEAENDEIDVKKGYTVYVYVVRAAGRRKLHSKELQTVKSGPNIFKMTKS